MTVSQTLELGLDKLGTAATACAGALTCTLSWLHKYEQVISSVTLIIGAAMTIAVGVATIYYKRKRYHRDLKAEQKGDN